MDSITKPSSPMKSHLIYARSSIVETRWCIIVPMGLEDATMNWETIQEPSNTSLKAFNSSRPINLASIPQPWIS